MGWPDRTVARQALARRSPVSMIQWAGPMKRASLAITRGTRACGQSMYVCGRRQWAD
jgi:hypothetical protein